MSLCASGGAVTSEVQDRNLALGAYRRVWPVTDATRGVVSLAAEALPDLHRALRQEHLRPVSHPRWAVVPGRTVPGSRGAETVLVAVVHVGHVMRPVVEAAA